MGIQNRLLSPNAVVEDHLRSILRRLLLLGRFPRKSPYILELPQ